MKLAPELWDRELAWVLRKKMLQDDIECSACDAEKVACDGLEIGDDGATFLPMLFGFEMDYPVGDVELLSEAPFVSSSETGGDRGGEVVANIVKGEMWKRLKEFWCLPCGKCTMKVLLGAENSELLKLVIRMTQDDFVA